MRQTTSWATKEEVHETFLAVLDELQNVFTKTNTALTEELFPVNKNTYHFIVKLLNPKNRIERAMCSHLFNIIYQSEILSQGGGPAAFLFSIGFAKFLLANDHLKSLANNQQAIQTYQKIAENISRTIQEASKVATPDTLLHNIRKATGEDVVLTKVAWEAINLAGLEGKIFIENGKQTNYLVEHKDGYTFNVKPFKYFLNGGNGTCWEHSQVKILVVDGVLEQVSEIDHLLMKTYETKVPLVVVAQGFSEEVVATLRTNQERGNFEAVPVRVMPDIESLNVVNDIAVACGTTPISSLKGDLLCFVKHDDLPLVGKVRCTQSEMVVENISSRSAVSAHIKALLAKRQNQKVEELTEYIDKRLKSLVSNSVVVHLPDMSSVGIDDARVKLDNALRACKTVLTYGTVNLSEDYAEYYRTTSGPSNGDARSDDVLHLTQAITTGLQMIDVGLGTKLPTLTVATALHIAGKMTLLMLLSNGMVCLD